ncbi:GNAT family N-acetyltransferase [Erysipelothrix sp. D19-032]
MNLLLETDRLIIRNYAREDLSDAAEFLMDEETMYYIPKPLSNCQNSSNLSIVRNTPTPTYPSY